MTSFGEVAEEATKATRTLTRASFGAIHFLASPALATLELMLVKRPSSQADLYLIGAIS
jgi:hypothetical protein